MCPLPASLGVRRPKASLYLALRRVSEGIGTEETKYSPTSSSAEAQEHSNPTDSGNKSRRRRRDPSEPAVQGPGVLTVPHTKQNAHARVPAMRSS